MMTITKKPTAIIFDFDDTLVDTKPIIKRSLQATFDEFDINKDVIQTKDIDVNRSLKDYFHEIFGDNVKAAREVFYSHYDNFAQDIKIIDNVEDVLNFLKKNKVYMTIVSNKNGMRLRNEINNKLAWGHYFGNIIGSGDAKADKPSHEPAKLSLEHLKLADYKNVWLIGDSIVDLRTAQNLGCIGVLFKTDIKEKPEDVVAHTQVDNHLELLNLLKEIYA